METNTKSKRIIGTLAVIAVMVGLLGGCATMRPEKAPTLVPTSQGTVVFLEKDEFIPPPKGWALSNSSVNFN